jgi:hypothetical protein
MWGDHLLISTQKKPFISGSIEVTPDAVGPGRPGWLRYDARAEVMGP